jgi:hypothetical protein
MVLFLNGTKHWRATQIANHHSLKTYFLAYLYVVKSMTCGGTGLASGHEPGLNIVGAQKQPSDNFQVE